MVHSMDTVTTAISNITLQHSAAGDVDLAVAGALVESMLTLLKGKSCHTSTCDSTLTASPEPSAFPEGKVVFADADIIVDRLQTWIDQGLKSSADSLEARQLVDECFAALLESSNHSPALLASFKRAARLPDLTRKLLLEEENPHIRHCIRKTVQRLCSTTSK